jgi:hypothetical protein
VNRDTKATNRSEECRKMNNLNKRMAKKQKMRYQEAEDEFSWHLSREKVFWILLASRENVRPRKTKITRFERMKRKEPGQTLESGRSSPKS